ncbi:type IV toxin-antitoxin system AbiEi family antitoxin domain-containing protein [Leifsonia xyli]|uniref:type IV toxin-antitoxin system AbiEi family antitoxin domain-containing protein n=1 Tax=Leifsonia xyli TaxID=1575 RepID=UPI003D671C9E
MNLDAREPSLPATVWVGHLRGRGETRQQHARAARRGDEVRIARGVYADSAAWETLGAREQHVIRLGAYARRRAMAPVFSHWSAAALHGMPFADDHADAIHVAVGRTSGGRSARDVRAHSIEVPSVDIVEVAGVRCTSAGRTAVDLAATAQTAESVAIADRLLHRRLGGRRDSPGDRTVLLEAWMRGQPLRGHRRALDVIEFADGRAESPLESISRVAMYEAGFPRPVLQEPILDANGLIGYADFAWPEHGIVGEADGDAKYLDPALRGRRSADRVVLDEKVREDRLRAAGWKVVRWRWAAARGGRPLAEALTAAGLPSDPRRRWDDCGVA